MTTHDKQIDQIFRSLNSKGKFFKLQISLFWISYMPTAIQLLSNVFIGPPVPHRCASPTNESEFIDSYRNELAGYNNVTVSYDECEIHIKSNDTTIKKESCLFGMDYDLPIDSSFVSQFDLVCDSTNLARLTQTLVIAGQACGALIAAGLSDRFGRKPNLIGAHIGITIAGIAVAYSTNYVMFSIFKFIVGAFQQAIVTITINIFIELLRIKDRRLNALLIAIFWVCGVILLDVTAYTLRLHSWRTLQLVISCFATIPALLEICFLKESLRWLLANGRTRDASAYIKNAARMNGKTEEDIKDALKLLVLWDKRDDDTPMNGSTQQADEIPDIDGKPSQKLSYLDLFRNRRLFLNMLVLWVAWFTVVFAFFAIYLGTTTLSGDLYINFFLTTLMEALGGVYCYFALNRHGRKTVLIVLFSTMSVGLIASGIFRSLGNNTVYSGLSVTFNMVAMIGASGGFGAVFFYTPELFPTNIRNQALGICSTISRIGGMLAPFTAILGDQAKWGPGVLIGGLACLVVLLIRFLPETNGRELPQTLEDLQSWFKKDGESNSYGVVDVENNDKNTEEDDQNVNLVEWHGISQKTDQPRLP